MIPRPTALGLSICEKIIVEERTRNVSLINTFNKMICGSFPSIPQSFCVFAILTDGRGDGIIQLTVNRLATNEDIYEFRDRVRFPDQLAEVRSVFRINDCSFPDVGWYELLLSVDGEWVAGKRIQVSES